METFKGRNYSTTVGDVYGRLTIIGFIRKGAIYFDTRCTCGVNKQIRAVDIIKGKTLSCGCLRRDMITQSNITHGLTQSRQYRIWQGMKDRCTNKQNDRYIDYGGRGISYDPKWQNFKEFWGDMKDGYSDDLSLDRVDNNGNYCKENCRWVDSKTQSRNTRKNRNIEYGGDYMCLKDWAAKLNISYGTLTSRLNSGWTVEKALSTKVLKKGKKVDDCDN